MTTEKRVATERTTDLEPGELVAEDLLPLLQEYTARVRAGCDRRLRQSTPWSAWLLTSATTLLVGVVMGSLYYTAFHLPGSDAKDSHPPYALLSCVALAVIVASVTISHVATDSRRRSLIERHDLAATTAGLERLVRISSQLEDHAVNRLGMRVQLELRLADAEAALTFSKDVLGPGAVARFAASLADLTFGFRITVPTKEPLRDRPEPRELTIPSRKSKRISRPSN